MRIDGKLLGTFFFATFVVQGLMTYYLGIKQSFLIPYAFAILIGFRVMVSDKIRFIAANAIQSKVLFSTLAFFWLCFFVSAFVNESSLFSVVGISKNYILVWSIFFFVGVGLLSRKRLENIYISILSLSIIQLPFSFSQRIYFAKQSGSLNWDGVVGTFGGDPFAGGFSGAMTVFQVCSIILVLALYERKVVPRVWVLLVSLSVLLTILLGEVKIVILIIPLAGVIYFRSSLLKSPMKLAVLSGFLVCFYIVMSAVYIQMYDNAGLDVDEGKTLFDNLDYEGDVYWFNPETREVSRIGSLLIWHEENVEYLGRYFFGHGPSASRDSKTFGVGQAAQKYPFTLSTSTASIILWDLGVLGFSLFLLIHLVLSFYIMRAIENPYLNDKETSLLESYLVYTVLTSVLLVYNSDAINTVQSQVCLSFIAGHVVYLRRQIKLKNRVSRRVYGAC